MPLNAFNGFTVIEFKQLEMGDLQCVNIEQNFEMDHWRRFTLLKENSLDNKANTWKLPKVVIECL